MASNDGADLPPPTTAKKAMKRTDCAVCTRSMPNSSFPILSTLCTHPRQTCRKCWNEWLQSQVSTVPADQIRCTQCPRVLDDSDVKRLARPATYATYSDSQLKAALSAIPDFHWCIAPGCGSGQQLTGGNIFTCNECELKACIHCAVEWHEGETCDAYQYRIRHNDEDEEASELEVQKISKICPGCKAKVQKISGCDHITCTQCREEFCWICLTDYRGIRQIGNSHHKANCTHYRPLPPAQAAPFPPLQNQDAAADLATWGVLGPYATHAQPHVAPAAVAVPYLATYPHVVPAVPTPPAAPGLANVLYPPAHSYAPMGPAYSYGHTGPAYSYVTTGSAHPTPPTQARPAAVSNGEDDEDDRRVGAVLADPLITQDDVDDDVSMG